MLVFAKKKLFLVHIFVANEYQSQSEILILLVDTYASKRDICIYSEYYFSFKIHQDQGLETYFFLEIMTIFSL